MSTPKTISVHPGHKTLGEFHAEGVLYHETPSQSNPNTVTYIMPESFINFITAIPGGCTKTISTKLLVVRLIVSGILLAAYFTGFLANFDLTVQVAALVAAVSIVSGLATRVVSLGVTVIFFVSACTTIFSGHLFADAFISLMFALCTFFVAIVGPGLFSFDQITKYCLLRRQKQRIRKKLTGRRITYRAYWD